MATRTKIFVKGIVQGVGFRPFVYSLAKKRGLRGSVANNGSGVVIDIEGEATAIEHFVREVESAPPSLSQIESVTRENAKVGLVDADFRIVPSAIEGSKFVPISADVSTCDDCLAEMRDPTDRRYRYPFINCTNCGPRFTIVESVPYDRERTTMRDFKMCEACRTEYLNPLDRRFHAEPTACPECGPRLRLTDGSGFEEQGTDIIERTRELLRSGKIIAIKGIGGFHLACDALSDEAVHRLRQRKYREDKPFALMAGSIDMVRRYCEISEAEGSLLTSRERPIVLLEKKPDTDIPDEIAPRVRTLGFMLPYTPLHHLLLEGFDRPLVMTSGNVSDEPICYDDEDAARRLKSIADLYLLHDRRIHMRTDDSVVRVLNNGSSQAFFVRRSRGFAPSPIRTSFDFVKQILACGAELKNTFCLTRANYAFVSHHVGDLENVETLRSFIDGVEHFKRLFNIRPEAIAYDLHPEYLSTKYAHACHEIETKIGIQHHHAHIASCLADNGVDGEVIGVAMDGLGFGVDGKMWGGEFFVADLKDAERVAHLENVPMPGGANAIREPWRMAAMYLQKAFGLRFLDLELPFVAGLDRDRWSTMRSMIDTETNCPETSSMGRLFDAISALIGVRSNVNYEGQAAIEMEAIADRHEADSYEFEIDSDGIIKSETVIRRAVADLLNGVTAPEVSARFHLVVADLIATVALQVRDQRRLNRVALSGGVFQNIFLLERVSKVLHECAFEVFTHRRVPTNDGGISLGQAAIANAHIVSGRV